MECNISGSTIQIKGNVKHIQDNQTLKDALRSIQGDQITIQTRDVTVLTSEVIGTLVKLINVDKKKISIVTDNDNFIDLLSKLHLNTVIDIKKG